MKKWIYRSITSIIAAFLGFGCARPLDPADGASAGDERDDSAGQGGTGGSGGHAGSSGCALDCSSIQTPPCYAAICDRSTGRCAVVESPAGAACNDGRFCTVGETCKGGSCGGGSTNDCGMSPSPCTEAVCDEASRTCSPGPVVDGTPCKVADLCTVHPTCQGGVCIGVPKDCFFAPTPDDCHIGACNPNTGHCDPVPGNDGMPCTDKSDLCTVSKACSGGHCLGGEPKDCSSLTTGCLEGRCDPSSGQCRAEPVPEGSSCSEGIGPCNQGACDNLGACVPTHVPDGLACEDGDACTVGETCTAGVCKGGQPAVPVEYFRETFATNTAGWTPGTEWQIGPAKASPGGAGAGAEDPAVDHTLSDDNGIAGVVIGGYPSTNPHEPYSLVSPVIPTTAEGPVYLEFWRWLNGDAAPYMVETVDVYDGSEWVNLWTSGSPATHDVSWTKVTYRLTPYKSPKLQVRFGFSVGSSAYVVSGWNIDDLVIANAVCH